MNTKPEFLADELRKILVRFECSAIVEVSSKGKMVAINPRVGRPTGLLHIMKAIDEKRVMGEIIYFGRWLKWWECRFKKIQFRRV